jgi:hypothetical protein
MGMLRFWYTLLKSFSGFRFLSWQRRAITSSFLAFAALVSPLVLMASSTVQTKAPTEAQAPERVIVFHIDALHWQAPEQLGLENIRALARLGTSVTEAYIPVPWHPTTGLYGELHTTSLPNPVTMAGTLFLQPGHRMVQDCFYPSQLTAHIANSTAYESLNPSFNYVRLDRAMTDADVVRAGLDLLADTDVRFMRILLQDLNNRASQTVASTTKDVPWRGNIWGGGSPYIQKAREADRLLGVFIQGLKELGKWENTLLVLISDGQADAGWHPILSEESWRIPLIFVGPGVARGRVIPYAENIDIAPTICNLVGAPAPNTGPGTGRVLTEIREADNGSPPPISRRLVEFNRLIKEHLLLQAEMRLAAANNPCVDVVLMKAENSYQSEHQFFGLDQILEWHKAGSIDALLESNRKANQYLRDGCATCRG